MEIFSFFGPLFKKWEMVVGENPNRKATFWNIQTSLYGTNNHALFSHLDPGFSPIWMLRVNVNNSSPRFNV